jgi:hypothetical protein
LLRNNEKKASSKENDFSCCLARGGSKTTKPPTATVCKAARAEEQESRHLRFDMFQNETFLIPTIDELTDEELYAVYYDPVDFKVFKGCCLAAVESMKHGIPEDDSTRCYRGVESIGCPRKRLNKINGAFQVLDEQNRQFEEGICSPEIIAARYSLSSSPCRHAAFRRGLQDAKAVMSLGGS